jgi:NhaA family Na+:H+ antiporter
MATDIAFAIGVLVLLAKRVPQGLITFLVALAIVDDLGAVVVIALFYTEAIAVQWLLLSTLIVALLVSLNLFGVRRITPYFLLALLLWFALLQSGVHATLAGVIGAFTVPARPKYDAAAFSAHLRELLNRFDASHRTNANLMTNQELNAVAQSMETSVEYVQPLLLRLEDRWHLPVALLVIPLFALVNAGIPLSVDLVHTALANPVAQGIVVGLVFGKALGITAASWLALKLGLGQLPAHTRFSQIIGVSFLGGIGFTMAIFIAELAFAGAPELLLMAKTGVLFASLLAGSIGALWLVVCAARADKE